MFAWLILHYSHVANKASMYNNLRFITKTYNSSFNKFIFLYLAVDLGFLIKSF